METEQLCRILIVDDEQLIRKGIIHYLDWEQEGFTIAGEASNGREALELMETVHPHIIITDIVMPIMDGEELTRVVKERYPHIEIIILSSFSEYDYVRSTFQSGVVDYILKPKLDAASLLNGLKKAASKLSLPNTVHPNSDVSLFNEQIITNLISGYPVKWNEQETSKIFPYPKFYLLGVVKKNSSQETAYLETIVKEKIVKNLRSNVGNGVYYSCCPNKNLGIILINIEKATIEKVIDFANQLTELKPGIGFALSEGFSEFLRLGNVYKEELAKLLNYRFFLSEMPLLMKENLPKNKSHYDQFNLDWFTEELKCKRFTNALAYLTDHVADFSRDYTVDIFEYKAFFSNIVFNITILLSNMEYETNELDSAKYQYFRSFDEVYTAEEAVELLDSFIEEVNKCLLKSQSGQDNFNLKRLVQYINEHYAESLTLTELAEHFHFNPSYLSSYFSTHMQEGFIEYLNKVRIEEAAKLLKANTIPISEISRMVGYSDHSYFCKVFKKIKGLSPSQYKRLNK